MSHITCDAQRQENKEIHECPYRSVNVWRTMIDEQTGEEYEQRDTEMQCGEWIKLSYAQDKCRRCGKVFTY